MVALALCFAGAAEWEDQLQRRRQDLRYHNSNMVRFSHQWQRFLLYFIEYTMHVYISFPNLNLVPALGESYGFVFVLLGD